MNHQQLTELPPGTRLKVWQNGQYHKATFMQHIRGADPAAWIAFDDEQIEGRGTIAVRMTTDLQFTPEYWEERENRGPRKFLLLSEDELNAELIEGMGVGL